MKVLLLEAQPAIESTVARSLLDAGHELVRCYDELDGGPCRAVRHDADCPLSSRVGVAVVARESGTPDLLYEMGAVCAERRRVPVVRVDPNTSDDVVELAIAGAAAGLDRLEARYAAAVRTALGADVLAVEASRAPDGVTVSLLAPMDIDWRQRTMLADRARRAIRAFDSFVVLIDIAVTAADGATTAVAPDERVCDGADEWFVDDGDELWVV